MYQLLPLRQIRAAGIGVLSCNEILDSVSVERMVQTDCDSAKIDRALNLLFLRVCQHLVRMNVKLSGKRGFSLCACVIGKIYRILRCFDSAEIKH
jgi:hypothetical protein